MFLTLGKPLNVSDAPRLPQGVAGNREKFPIAVIDDHPFPRAENLRSHHYNIVEIGDIRKITDILAYPIVICDIQGVGAALGSSFGGAHVLKQIRLCYPQKYLIAYSGQRFNATFQPLLKASDISLKKDADLEEWTAALDKGIETVSDPILQWKRIRAELLSSELDMFTVTKLEHAYVKSLLSGDEIHINKSFTKINDKRLSSERIKMIGAATIACVKAYIELAS